jgi:hypothetical protein
MRKDYYNWSGAEELELNTNDQSLRTTSKE